jgi:hypothetical protein
MDQTIRHTGRQILPTTDSMEPSSLMNLRLDRSIIHSPVSSGRSAFDRRIQAFQPGFVPLARPYRLIYHVAVHNGVQGDVRLVQERFGTPPTEPRRHASGKLQEESPQRKVSPEPPRLHEASVWLKFPRGSNAAKQATASGERRFTTLL